MALQPFQIAMLNPARSGYTRLKPPVLLPPTHTTLKAIGAMGQDLTGIPTTDQINNILFNTSGGTTDASQTIDNFLTHFGIGLGRTEANIIVPFQNQLMYQLGLITNQFRTGMTPSVSQLLGLYNQVQLLANNFIQFVLAPRFTDRRASGQALNTVMPYVNGSCGYAVPLGTIASPSQMNCISWGDGTLGGVGTNGMLGALARAITAAGGTAPTGNVITNPPQIQLTGTGGGGTLLGGISGSTLMIIGIAALYLYSKR